MLMLLVHIMLLWEHFHQSKMWVIQANGRAGLNYFLHSLLLPTYLSFFMSPALLSLNSESNPVVLRWHESKEPLCRCIKKINIILLPLQILNLSVSLLLLSPPLIRLSLCLFLWCVVLISTDGSIIAAFVLVHSAWPLWACTWACT